MQKKYIAPADFVLLSINQRKSLFQLFLSTFFLLSFEGRSQVSNYSFAQSSAAYSSISSPINVFPATWDDNAIVSIVIPFSFTFNGVDYASCNISANGFITFGATPPAADLYNPISNNTAYSGSVSGFGRDLINNSSSIVHGVEGSSPNRVFVVQWINARRYDSGIVTGDVVNFQIRLYETSNSVQVRYGTNSATSTANDKKVQVGLRGATNTDYNNRYGANGDAWAFLAAGTDSADKANFKSTILPVSGLTFTWTPPPLILSLGTTSACSGSNIIINGRNLSGATAANVRVGGTPVTSITSNTGSTITAVLGIGTTGHVTVTAPNGTATSPTPFTVNPIPTDVSISSTISPTGATSCTYNYVRLEATGGVHNNAVAFSESFSGSPNWAYNVLTGVQGYYYGSATAGGTSPEGGLGWVSNTTGNWYFYPATGTYNYLPIDINDFTTLNLSFKHAFNLYTGAYTRGISVEVPTNSTAWTKVWEKSPIP